MKKVVGSTFRGNCTIVFSSISLRNISFEFLFSRELMFLALFDETKMAAQEK